MRYLVAILCTLGLLAAPSVRLSAAEFTDLFQAQVPSQPNQTQWQRAALSAVLVKLTGGEAVLSQPAIVLELKNSASYVKQFQSMQINAQSMILVHLDEQKITALLQRQQIPIWGSRRPDQLLWFAEKMQENPQFVLNIEHPLRKALQEQATLLGLSLVFPLYDVDDLALLNEQTLWTGDWQAIQVASQRYKMNHVHNLLFDQFTDASGTVTFRLTAQQWRNGQMESREYLNLDARQLAIEFCRQLAADLASQYAVKIADQHNTSSALTLTVDAVTNLTDLVKVQQIFASMLTVKTQHLKEFQQGRAVFTLELAASEDDFYRNISLVSELRAESPLLPAQSAEQLATEAQIEAQLAADSIDPVLATPTGAAGATALNVAEPASNGSDIVEEPDAGGPSALVAQTEGIQQTEGIEQTEVGIAPIASDQNAAITASDSLIKTNHFSFVGH